MEASLMSAHIIDPSKIQSELTKIWEGIDKVNKSRAALFNLVIYIEHNKRLDYIRSITQKVIEKFPSRVIFISVDKDAPQGELKTAVSVLTASSGEFVITCDLIEIIASKDTQMRIPFIILPHLIPDLPIYLLWGEDPSLKNPLLEELGSYATRLIFDSESGSSLQEFAKGVLKQKEQFKCDVADLNWARIEPFREILQSAFSSPLKIEELKEIKEMKICYNISESAVFCHPKVQATYLQAWIATRLNWTLKEVKAEEKCTQITYQSEKGEVKVAFETKEISDLPMGMILSLELSTNKNAHFLFERNIKLSNQVRATYSTAEKCLVPENFIFPKGGAGQSLIKEIFHKGTSLHYLKVLDLITKVDKNIC